MTLSDLEEVTRELQEIENEILEAFRHGRLADYAALAERLREARERFDEITAHSFEPD